MTEWLSENERTLLNSLYHLNHKSKLNTVLDEYMIKIRKKRGVLSPSKKYELYESDDLIQLWFQTPPCRFSVLGKCTMCNYWNGQHIPNIIQTIKNEVSLPDTCQTLLINTCGSCLDSYELVDEDFILLLDWLEQSCAKTIIFETHWSTLSEEKLCLIRKHIPQKRIMFEIGLESVNKDTLYYILNNPSSIIDIKSVVEKVHRHDGICIINIIFGVPFLTPEEQMADTTSSIKNLLDNNADYIVLFPINIKPQTLFMELYNHGLYRPVPIKIIADLLLESFDSQLDQINIAWFGDRNEDGVIQPQMCDICGSKTVSLLCKYNNAEDSFSRHKILEKIKNIECACTHNYLNQKKSGNVYERFKQYYEFILRSER